MGIRITTVRYTTKSRRFVYSDGNLQYWLHPTITESGGEPGYVLVQWSRSGVPTVVAIWWNPGYPEYIQDDWYRDDPTADSILDYAQEIVFQTWE